MRPIPPDANAFALAHRNLDRLPVEHRGPWAASIQAIPTRVPMPERVILELANTCNLDCPMCRVGRLGVSLDRVMSLPQLRRVADEVLVHAKEVRLNGLGETTVVPALHAYLDVLSELPATLELISNATGPDDIYERLLRDGATVLFSWDAADPELLRRLRGGLSYKQARRKVSRAASVAVGAGRADLVHLLFTLQRANLGELPAVVGLAAQMGVRHVVVNTVKSPKQGWFTSQRPRWQADIDEAEAMAAGSGVQLYLPDQIGGHAVAAARSLPTSASHCDRPWREVAIRYDLSVQVCNMFNPYTYGNLNLSSFDRIWEGAFAHAFREHVNGRLRHPYCRDCAYVGDVYERKTA